MADALVAALTVVAALGSGLIAGVFFAFSAFVMRALARLPTAGGVAAMQAINVAVLNPLFLGAFVGTAVASVALIVVVVLRWGTPGSACTLVGGVVYLVGTFLTTGMRNVPLNNALAEVTPADPAAGEPWADYVRRWTAWNHVRTVAALAAAGSFIVALTR